MKGWLCARLCESMWLEGAAPVLARYLVAELRAKPAEWVPGSTQPCISCS